MWFFFITAGLPGLGRPTDDPGLQGDLLWLSIAARGTTEGPTFSSCLGLLVLLSLLGVAKERGLRTAGDIRPGDFPLRPGDALGLFGVVSKLQFFSSTRVLFESFSEGDNLSCFSEFSFGLESFSEGFSC